MLGFFYIPCDDVRLLDQPVLGLEPKFQVNRTTFWIREMRKKVIFLIFSLMKHFNAYIFSLYSSSRIICRILTFWDFFDFCGLQTRCEGASY